MNVTTDLTIAGRIAQFGSGMIKEVSAKLLGQFVTCLEGRLGGDLPAAGLSAAGAVVAGTGAAASGGAAGSQPAPAATWPGSPVQALLRVSLAAATAAGAAVAASAERAPIDLMSVAGSAVYKRLVPLVIGIVVVTVVIYLIVR